MTPTAIGDKVEGAASDVSDNLIDKFNEEQEAATPPETEPDKTPEPTEPTEPEGERQVEPVPEEVEKKEPEAEPEKPEPEAPQFDLESIEDPVLKEFIQNKILALETVQTEKDDLDKEHTELKKIHGQHAREVGTARELVSKDQDDFGKNITDLDQGYLETSAKLSEKLTEAQLSQNFTEAAQIQGEMQTAYQIYMGERQRRFGSQAKKTEDAFLAASNQSGEDYSSVTGKFDEYCEKVGHNPYDVKINHGLMSSLYPELLMAERGRNVERLVKEAYEKGKQQAARVTNAASAPAGTVTKVTEKKPGKDPTGLSTKEAAELLDEDRGLSIKKT